CVRSVNNIDKVTPYKDEHYWQLYESIESFLYGELNMEHTNDDGVFWGISNFYQIWEDMCNTYAFSKFNVLYSDTNIVFKGERISNNRSGNHKIYKKSYFEDPFFIQFREKKRLMRPDLIHLVGSSITGETFKSFIDIIPIKDSNNQIDFRVHFIDNKSNKKLSKYFKRLYKAFISNLKQSLNSGKRTSHRIHGASFRNNVFKNYPKDELTKQKNYLIDRTCDKNSYIILDWKYMDNDSFQYKNKKIDIDISKQICYEFCLKNSKDNDNYSIESQFIFPYYYDDLELDIGDFMNEKKLYHRINENNIKVFKANFNKIQDIYLKNDT
ncbi:MAG: hypothetical protein KAI02_03935, partial [Gammaproteobacteria bacterium]|nr:hypothetical protein [Gammaproteobacteria bacterium]